MTYTRKLDAFMVFVGKPEGNSSHERTRRGGEGNINTVVNEEVWTKWSGFTWLKVGQMSSYLNMVTNFRAP